MKIQFLPHTADIRMKIEAPIAYKDVNLVVDTVSVSGIARKVAKLRPVAVVMG